jgi:hypothetical protein
LFERPHHQRVAQVLSALDGPLLRENKCLFGGGTLIALRYGEYRESVDIDFMVSDLAGYRTLRQLLTGPRGIAAIGRRDAIPLKEARELRADQYGIRTALLVGEEPIKFEIVLEGRVELAAPTPSDEVCGIATLTPLDMVTGKLLANSDRWADDAAFSRSYTASGIFFNVRVVGILFTPNGNQSGCTLPCAPGCRYGRTAG